MGASTGQHGGQRQVRFVVYRRNFVADLSSCCRVQYAGQNDYGETIVSCGTDEHARPTRLVDPLIVNSNRSPRLGLLAGYIQLPILVVANVVVLALVVRGYGAIWGATWILVYGLMSLIEQFNLGLGLTMVNDLAREPQSSARRQLLGRYLRAATTAAGGMVLFFVLLERDGRTTEWLAGRLARELPDLLAALPVLFVLAAVKMPLYLATTAFQGLERVHWTRLYQAAYVGATLPALLLARARDAPPVFAFAVFQGLQLLVLLVAAIHLHRALAVDDASPFAPPLSPIFSVRTMRYFVVQMVYLLIINLNVVVLAHVASPREVTGFAAMWRIAIVLITVINMLPQTLWPTFARLLARREDDALTFLLRDSMIMTMLAGSGAAVGMVWATQPFIAAWIGAPFYLGLDVAAALAIYVFAQSIGLTALNLVHAADMPVRWFAAIVGYSVLTIVLALLLGIYYGPFGAALGIGLTTVVCYPALAATVPSAVGLAGRATTPWAAAIQLIVATFALMGAAALVATAGMDRAQTVASGIAVQLLWAAVGWRFLPRSTRDFIVRRFRRR